MSRIPYRHFILCKVASKTISIFIHADILVLVSELLVVVILSEWWSGPTTADRCWHIPGCMRITIVYSVNNIDSLIVISMILCVIVLRRG